MAAQTPNAEKTKGAKPAESRLKEVASVVGVSNAASYAKTAHMFGVPDSWDRYAPHRLALVTEVAALVLVPARLGLTCGFALLALMARFVSHDHLPSVRLRIGLRAGEVPDLWYCWPTT